MTRRRKQTRGRRRGRKAVLPSWAAAFRPRSKHWILLPLLGALLLGTAFGYGLAVGRKDPGAATASNKPVTVVALPPSASGESSRTAERPLPERRPLADRPAVKPQARETHPQTLAWMRNAVPAGPTERPMIAVVLDDLGLNQAQTRRAVALPGPLTLAFLTYADNLSRQTGAARAAGHELLVHLPMEATDSKADAGPKALLSGLAETELLERLRWGLSRFDGYVGVNNHMGSRFTGDAPGMALVLRELKGRGLLFLDSRTTADSVGVSLARSVGLPHAARDVFLDHEQSHDFVRASLAVLEERARKTGYAIGIGHPHAETLDVIGPWLATLRERGFALVPVSAIVKRMQERPAVEAARSRTG